MDKFGTTKECPKCGWKAFSNRLVLGGPEGDFMNRICLCGYTFQERPLDWKENELMAGEETVGKE